MGDDDIQIRWRDSVWDVIHMKKSKKIVILTLVLIVTSCVIFVCFGNEETLTPPVSEEANVPLVDDFQAERDIIYTLMAYSVVYKDWQNENETDKRGYNIGSVLVNKTGHGVYWARNSVYRNRDGTRHGEVRLITQYLNHTDEFNLREGYTIYTTLEPCAMCAGMMTLTSVNRTVYGQTDPGFGKALERLQFNSTSIGGYEPYPRSVISDPSRSRYLTDLDTAYQEYLDQGYYSITRFLATDTAKTIFTDAEQDFLTFNVTHPENEDIYTSALEYYNSSVTSYYMPDYPP